MLLGQAYLLWRSGDPDAGLPHLERTKIRAALARDDEFWSLLSLGQSGGTVIEVGHKFGAQILNFGGERTHTQTHTMVEHSLERAIEYALATAGDRVKRFPGYLPSAGALGMLRAPRRLRSRSARLQERYADLDPFTLCMLSGTWIVSRVDDKVTMRLPELKDRDWLRWRSEPLAEDAWLTITCPASALTVMGVRTLDHGAATLNFTVVAVPLQPWADAPMQMRLVVAYS